MLIDSHCHLDMQDFSEDFDGVLERAAANDVNRMVTVGIDYDSSDHALTLARRHDCIYAAVGCHPHHAETGEEELTRLAELAADPEVIAWGEIGLDFYRRRAPEEVQLASFARQLEMAEDLKLPVIIHDRDAHEETLNMLRRMGKGERKGVIHCFSGDPDLAEAFIGLGYYVSIPGTVTYKGASTVRAVAAAVSLEHLLVETDAPFLAPVPVRGKRNEPGFVAYTAKEIARVKGTDLEEVALRTSENAEILFGLRGKP